MTFLKFLIFKLKNSSASYWKILSLRIFVRLLGMITVFYFLVCFDADRNNGPKYWYSLTSTFFYALFFVFLEWYLKASLKHDLKDNLLKWLNILMYVPLCFTLILISLTAKNNLFAWPKEIIEYIIYAYTRVWPMVFIPNMSFIIITLLIFYASAILKRNEVLKLENDLTI
ncbi:hypothetical protein ASE74_13970 [Pedobacter sp. Leaf216]|uniref:hypothetical protein n=1 Tax=Pedobacter sp. Leaf216 TaxID=1735684 RepID=UPI0006FCF8DF|nr:hypothetical protein [Pedobacter sp. Leaf216]KQM78599.1 hypothetical protein ASE74_13970 [Pedobacter sp. Leaf216]